LKEKQYPKKQPTQTQQPQVQHRSTKQSRQRYHEKQQTQVITPQRVRPRFGIAASRLIFASLVLMALGACAYDPAEPGPQAELSRLRDLEIVGETVITTSPEKVNRLILRKGARVFTRGNDVTLSADEILSEEVVIDTTPDPITALLGETGRGGGSLKIFAARAQGSLHIVSAGQAGGAGRSGTTGGGGFEGGRGSDGKSGYTTECLRPMWTFDRDPGGPGRCHKSWYCERATGNGGQGGIGKPGSSGEVGQAGGDTAEVLVRVDEPGGFRVTYELKPGAGGPGGAGGAGGPGGPGGEPGSPTSYCRAAGRGPQGPQGPSGPAGAIGATGNSRAVCLRLGAAEIGDCRPFTDMTR
jgi:hypothetical protein